MNLEEKRKALSRITGFLIAEFEDVMPNGKKRYGLTKQGYEMVLAGYACGGCLAIFDRFTLLCPACGTWHDVGSQPQETPQHWVDHIEERYADIPHEKPAVVNPFLSGDDSVMQQIRSDPTVEQVDLTERTKKTRRKP